MEVQYYIAGVTVPIENSRWAEQIYRWEIWGHRPLSLINLLNQPFPSAARICTDIEEADDAL